jgi:hypothetical protein
LTTTFFKIASHFKRQHPDRLYKGGFMNVFRKIIATSVAMIFCLSLAVAVSNAQGRHGWNGRHDNGRHLGWYKNRRARVYYRTSNYPTYRYYTYRRSYSPVYYGYQRYYPSYYQSYGYSSYYRHRRAYWRQLRMRRLAYWRYRHYRRYRYMRYRRL